MPAVPWPSSTTPSVRANDRPVRVNVGSPCRSRMAYLAAGMACTISDDSTGKGRGSMRSVFSGVVAVLKWSAIGIGSLIALTVIGSVVVPPLTRSFTDRWGATDAEVAEVLPGDAWVKDARQSATRAITIGAPAGLVNQLVRQQGYKRAGWHGWDWFYNATGSGDFVDGNFSTGVVPELQSITVGDKVFINKMVSYTVAIDDRPEVFALYSGSDANGRSLDASESAKAVQASTSWVWVARSEGPNTTRLILRIRGDMRGQGGFVAWLFDNPLDFGGALFANKTLHGIKDTAESLAAGK
jgi:hypothetical protein